MLLFPRLPIFCCVCGLVLALKECYLNVFIFTTCEEWLGTQAGGRNRGVRVIVSRVFMFGLCRKRSSNISYHALYRQKKDSPERICANIVTV